MAGALCRFVVCQHSKDYKYSLSKVMVTEQPVNEIFIDVNEMIDQFPFCVLQTVQILWTVSWSWSWVWYGPLSSTTLSLCLCGMMSRSTTEMPEKVLHPNRDSFSGYKTDYPTYQSGTLPQTGMMVKPSELLSTLSDQVWDIKCYRLYRMSWFKHRKDWSVFNHCSVPPSPLPVYTQ